MGGLLPALWMGELQDEWATNKGKGDEREGGEGWWKGNIGEGRKVNKRKTLENEGREMEGKY